MNTTLQHVIRSVAVGGAFALSLSLIGPGCGDGGTGTGSATGSGGAGNTTAGAGPGATSTSAATGGGCDSAKQGFTTCNGAGNDCQPGQYCQDIQCTVGCLSDVNCACNQVCDTTASVCKNVQTTTGPSTSASSGPHIPITTCDEACERGHACGDFSAAETTTCKQQCPMLPADIQSAFIMCVDIATDCPDVKTCFPM